METIITSLCEVQKDGSLIRLADIVGQNLLPRKPIRRENFVFEGKKLISKLSNTPPWTVGVWQWSCGLNHDKIKIKLKNFVKSNALLRFFLFPEIRTAEELLELLQEGVSVTHIYEGRTFFAFPYKLKDENGYRGIYCRPEEFSYASGKLKLSLNAGRRVSIHFLKLRSKDLIGTGDLVFVSEFKKGISSKTVGYIALKNNQTSVSLEVASQKVNVKSADELPQESKQTEYRQAISDRDVAYRLRDQALNERNQIAAQKGELEKQLQAAEARLQTALKEKQSAEEQKDAAEVQLAQTLRRQEETEQRLKTEQADAQATIQRDLRHLNAQRDDAQTALAELERQIDEKKREIDAVCAEFDQVKEWRDEAFEEARGKFAELRRDPRFIAELAALLPLLQSSEPQAKKRNPWKYDVSPINGSLQIAENWRDELALVAENFALALGVDADWARRTAAFLYSCFLNKAPLLIAGPFAYEIADITSSSVSGTRAGKLQLGNDGKIDVAEVVEFVKNRAESTIVVENMLEAGWSDALPQALSRCGKWIVWSRPYVEDLLVEPRGLFNYATPFFSESFVVEDPAAIPVKISERAPNFKEFASSEKSNDVWKLEKLGLSRLVINRLTKIICETRQLAEITNDPKRRRETDILFGTLPFAALTGKTNVLREILEARDDWSSRLTTEIARYVDVED